ncbi:MAG: Xaa-Pro peptidase family protein [Trueperaceae bacterium]|nr:Xaa-Pro peptidase family protein [Trueperaceae bacterium]
MTDRLSRVRAAMEERSLAAMLVTGPANVRWLSGFTSPADARVLITRTDVWLLTDGRYVAQAEQESRLPAIIERDWMGVVAERVRSGPLGVEAEHLTLAAAARLAGRVGEEPVRTEGLVTELRLVKDDAEVDAIRRAAALTDRAYQHVLTVVRPGLREVDVALEIERFVRSEGGDGMAFDVIVASGARSAMPHGLASHKDIRAGELITIDMGARLDGYCADMTRTFGVGEVSDAHQALFDHVLEAQALALDAVRPGVSGQELDGIAREVLRRHGLGDAFVHGLGHGVGLDVHEGPSLGPNGEDVLAPGMVITVEPGAYRPGDAGVRVEDLVVVTDDGHEVLSRSPKGWRALDVAQGA